MSLSPFEDLPDDVVSHILAELPLNDLLILQRLSKELRHKIHVLGLPQYLSSHAQQHITLHPRSSVWSPRDLIRHQHLVSRAITKRKWYALQIGQTWPQPVIPVLHVDENALVLGVGGKVVIHPLYKPHGGAAGGKVVQRAQEYPITKRGSGSGADIVGIVPLSDGSFGVAQYDGTLQRYDLPIYRDGKRVTSLPRSTAHFPHPKGANIHTLASDGDTLMTTTASGLVSLFTSKSPWIAPSTFSLAQGERSWSSLLDTRSDSIYIGTGEGISIYPYFHTSSSSSSSPSTPLKPSRQLSGPDLPRVSSAYDLSLPPPSSSHHPSTLLSAWFDSHLRLHDLRSSSHSPVAEFHDPYAWADGSAMYSTTFVGEHHIAGGGARHGTVCIFDVRYPKIGWSCFSPGGKGSPVYALKGEGGRLWGVSERRAFVLAFDHHDHERESEQDERMEWNLGAAGGVVADAARASRPQVEHRVNGWKGRGGKWGWTVGYPSGSVNAVNAQNRQAGGGTRRSDRDGILLSPSAGASSAGEGEGTVGYDHADRTVRLFDSFKAPWPQ